ncbi:MAG: hypothetical protein JWO50_626 [Candidatus Kaiserbacteria bacterium]|nr:hypothetical protein [Candidatus Kaiserbacteria bacterium]
MAGLFHIHKRKRSGLYPARQWNMRLLDRVVYVAGIIGPLSTIPQIYKIFAFHNASGVSISTWAICAVLDIPWIFYAIAHKSRPLFVCYMLWLICNTIIAVGAILYSM